jgi:Protein of unknown function (DUF499)
MAKNLQPWYKVVNPREDLREGKPLDASEFAVHLDQVRENRAPKDYQDPKRFFERTYLTRGLSELASEVIRRLSGEKTETSAVFNMATQFGGGKTHALTLLYHLAQNGPTANGWPGVKTLLAKAGVNEVPAAATATFVGTEFDSLTGRGGADGTPLRKTPWGEIAFQLGGEEGLAIVAEHEKQMIAPAGDVIRNLLPDDRPTLILMDELMNYVSRNRKSGLGVQLYDFLHNLSETARGQNNVVLAVSIPASELEMTAEDQSDYERFKKVLDRLGKAVIMSAEAETSEIIRRRLFEWDERAMDQDGRVLLSKEAIQTCSEYADWVVEHKQQVGSFPVENARAQFEATYPFHPTVLSVFERKWQQLPRFQQTRGVLRLLALWVSRAYKDGWEGAHRDPLIGLGTAPLDDPMFRAAVFEQLGESKLEGAVTTDICGKVDANATRLDKEAVDTIKKARLHRKVATAVFFESNGGQARAEATAPEIRMDVAEPSLDIGNVETVLEALASACYFLSVEKNRYRFSLSPNLNKLLADRRATIKSEKIDGRVRAEVQKVFPARTGVERTFFPEKSSQILDRPILTLVVLPPEQSLAEKNSLGLIEKMTRETGKSNRTFKSSLIWCVAESPANLQEDARKTLAWEDIDDEDSDKLDEGQRKQLAENLKKAGRDLKESVWRTYKNLVLLGKDNTLRVVDLGLVHSSAADNLVTYILNRLRQDGDLEDGVSPNFLLRNWPGMIEWSTKSVRDAFFASPLFPRLLNADAVKDTIARGVASGHLGYVGKTSMGSYDPFNYGIEIGQSDVEVSDEMFIISKETALAYISSGAVTPGGLQPPLPGAGGPTPPPTTDPTSGGSGIRNGRPGSLFGPDVPGAASAATLKWTGEVTAQKWMNFYTKVLARFAAGKGLKLTVSVEASPEDGISNQRVEETKVALRELGLQDDVQVE